MSVSCFFVSNTLDVLIRDMFVSRFCTWTLNSCHQSLYLWHYRSRFSNSLAKSLENFPFLSFYDIKYCTNVQTFNLKNLRHTNRWIMWSRDMTRVSVTVLSLATQRHQSCCLILRFRIRMHRIYMQLESDVWFRVSWNIEIHLVVLPYKECWYKWRNCQMLVLAGRMAWNRHEGEE